MMIRLNSKGFTAIELLVTFLILSFVVVGMFDVLLNYKDKEQLESIRSSVADYENKMTKIIQDDLTKGHLVRVKQQTTASTNELSASFDMNNTVTNKKYSTNLTINLDNGDISYGKSGEEITYSIPKINGLTINKKETSINILGDDNKFVKISMGFSHPEFEDDELLFSITAPINYPLNLSNGSILTGEVTLNGSDSFEVINQATYNYTVASNDDYVKVRIKNTSDTTLYYYFYYYTDGIDTTDSSVSIGYLTSSSLSIPFSSGLLITPNSSYREFCINFSGLKDKNIKLGVTISTTPTFSLKQGKRYFNLINKLSKIIKFKQINSNNINDDDPNVTFIAGNVINNYVWYSGHLWRAVSIDKNTGAVKLITDQPETFISYGSLDSNGVPDTTSNVSRWLKKFNRGLRKPTNYVLSTSYNYSSYSGSGELASTSLVTSEVGLLNAYEYLMTLKNGQSYLNIDSSRWRTQTPVTGQNGILYTVNSYSLATSSISNTDGIRPVIVLNGNLKISSGEGTSGMPYLISGDNCKGDIKALASGEYIKFASLSNKRFRVVSKTDTTIKVVATAALYNWAYSNTDEQNSTLYQYLNQTYYNNLGTSVNKRISDSNFNVTPIALQDSIFATSKRLSAKIGFLQLSDLLNGYCNNNNNNCCLLMTPTSSGSVFAIKARSGGIVKVSRTSTSCTVAPAFTLKITYLSMTTSGDGTARAPYTLR